MVTKNKKLIENKRKLSLIFNRKTLFWSFAVFFVVTQILFTIQTSATGSELISLEDKEKELFKESQKLSEELIYETSLTRSQLKADELGFIKTTNTVYIKSDEAVAKLP